MVRAQLGHTLSINPVLEHSPVAPGGKPPSSSDDEPWCAAVASVFPGVLFVPNDRLRARLTVTAN
jgi:hypothetical protein